MRYLVQLIIPVLIFVSVAWYATSRRRRSQAGDGEQPSDLGMFIAILVIGAVAAIGIAWATQALWEPA